MLPSERQDSSGPKEESCREISWDYAEGQAVWLMEKNRDVARYPQAWWCY